MKKLTLLFLVFFPISGIAQQVTWDVSLWGKRRAFTEHVEKLSELVAQKTNGEFILNLSYGGLAKPKENLDGISAGLFEMAQFCAGYHKEKNPSITVLELPFLGVNTLAEERTISQWLYRHPSVRQDFRKWNAIALMPSPLPQYNLIGVGQAPDSLLQLSGLNVRATGGIGRAMETLGAYPSPIVATEVRQALETGKINAVAFAPHAHVSFGTIANATWWTTNLNPGTVNCPVVANLDAVAELTKAHRDALYGSINEALDYYLAHYEYNMNATWAPVLRELGIEEVTFNEAEISQFRERVEKPAALEWIQEQEKIGLPARDIYFLVKTALAGENPEQMLLTGTTTNNSFQISNAEGSTRKQQILDTYTFDKKNSPVPTQSTLAYFDNNKAENQVVADQELELVAPTIQPDAIEGGIPALFYDDSSNQQDNNNTNPTIINTAMSGTGNYFGHPRNSTENVFEADPLKTLVEWDLEDSSTVGSTIASLSDFIGYRLQTNDQTAIEVYGLKLPSMQQKMNRITVGDAFQLLSGRGLVTIFDHTYRTVEHVPMKRRAAADLLPCPTDLNLGSRIREGVLLLPDGSQCSY